MARIWRDGYYGKTFSLGRKGYQGGNSSMYQMYRYFGRNHIQYEYVVNVGAKHRTGGPWEKAVDVRSVKSSKLYDNGYRIGQYQPIGDKRYFTYYQIKALDSDQGDVLLQEYYLERQLMKLLREGLSDE